MNQSQALTLLQSGASIFLTGEPGSGKTHLVNTYTSWLKKRKVPYAVTATTGIAATHIGGRTIHSWSGIGVRDTLTEVDLKKIAAKPYVTKKIKSTKVLIIDEISMLSAQMLDCVDQVCRYVRKDELPFGGIQMVLVGDFFQLPPVTKVAGLKGTFAYHATSWQRLDPYICYLTTQYRQSDTDLSHVLTAIRSGQIDTSHSQILDRRITDSAPQDVTHFMPRNEEVDRINAAKLAELSGATYTYAMHKRGDERAIASLLTGCTSPETLELKIGAIVMFTKNDIETRSYVNGTIGRIKSFTKERHPVVSVPGGEVVVYQAEWSYSEGDKVIASLIQIPLRLGWAITIHKSQGMSMDRAHIDLTQAFEYGQGYVALSRVRTLAGLTLTGYNIKSLMVDPQIILLDQQLRAASETLAQSITSTPVVEVTKSLDLTPTVSMTVEHYRAGQTPAEIARMRELTERTIYSHLCEWYAAGGELDYDTYVSQDTESQIMQAAKIHGYRSLTLLKQALPDSISYVQLSLVRVKATRLQRDIK